MANSWKRIYDSNGQEVSNAKYYSKYGIKGQGTFSKDIPGAFDEIGEVDTAILGCGEFISSSKGNTRIFGQGMYHSSVDIQQRDIRFTKEISHLRILANANAGICFSNYDLHNLILERPFNLYQRTAYNCVSVVTGVAGQLAAYNCTWINALFTPPSGHATAPSLCYQSLFKDSWVGVGNGPIGNARNNYNAFENCQLTVDNGASYFSLKGANAEELKLDFVNQINTLLGHNFTPKDFAKWIFSNNSTNENGEVLKGSEIDLFQSKNGIYIGHSPAVDAIPIRELEEKQGSSVMIPKSYNPLNSIAPSDRENIRIEDNSISLNASVPNDSLVRKACSGWIPLGGLKVLKEISIGHNLPADLGVIASTSSILIAYDKIVATKHYVVRSKNSEEAIITYNGKQYSSNLSSRKNVFIGVASVPNYTTIQGEPEVLLVNDLANAPTIDVRLVASFAPDVVGARLENNSWYYVAADENSSGEDSYVKYGKYEGKDVLYPVGASLLVKDELTYEIIGSCHLRKIIADDENVNPFVTVAITALQAVYENPFSTSIAKDANGVLIGSAHPNFENAASGANGYRGIVKDLFGSVVQVKVGILMNA